MRHRSIHPSIPAIVLALATLAAGEATAAIKKYRVKNQTILQSEDVSPPVDFTGAEPQDQDDPPLPAAMIDESTPGSPVLKKFVLKAPGGSITVDVGGPFIFVRARVTEGPGPLGDKPSSFTGTGSTADGSTIRWGIVTGWTISGALYCKSSPPVICGIGMFGEDTTSEPFFDSDFYDLGTWTFHGTGFTATPYVNSYNTTQTGNNMRWYRGFPIVDATVPALPLAGVTLLGASLVVGAVVALRHRRD